MKNRILTLLVILIVFSTTPVAQASAKGEGSSMQNIGESPTVKYVPKPGVPAEYQLANSGQANNGRNILSRPYSRCLINKTALSQRISSYLHFGKSQLLYHRRCSNWLSSLPVN
jgi:hypothetical protein